MQHIGRIDSILGRWLLIGVVAILSGGSVASSGAEEFVLKDGRVLNGRLGKVSSLAESIKPNQGNSEKLQLILLLDDNLRRTFFSERLVQEVRQEGNRQVEEKFVLHQKVARVGPSIQTVGRPMRIQPFDEFGRRIFTMPTGRGPVDVIQGITELTPQWTRVEGISHVWDMRIATSTIPRDVLKSILLKQIDLKNPEHYRKVARFYLQCERYEEARLTLEAMAAAFPDQADLKQQLAPSLQAIAQLAAQRLLAELRLRRDAGQEQLAAEKLAQFPTEGVGGDILQGVREMIEQHETRETRRVEVVKHLRALAEKLSNTIAQENLRPIFDEMETDIGPATIDRMAAFLQNAEDTQTSDAQKIALAISGWLLGADAATEELPKAISAYRVRGMIRKYLNELSVPEREQLLSYLNQESAREPAIVAGLLSHMKPAADPPKAIADRPGYFELEAPGLAEDAPITYCVQLPPEYDPYRPYPAIVTLSGAGMTAQQQIDWWAGAPGDDGVRSGHAMRYGYIVIAPVWTAERQNAYGYSAHEHAAVLNSLRDACRRFSIDTDRVFLSGYSIGGDAAWDLGLAHPDLWAGVLPIAAKSDRYCPLYWENARYVPFYFTAGELDGGKMTTNALDLDRYLRRGFDTTVVEYLGRGHEDFHDEILRMFDWMGRFRRDFFPKKFACDSMRSWDNFFWWVEVQGLPPRSLVDPSDWPPPRGSLPVQITGSINEKNGINVTTGTSQATVWLSPKMIDFKLRSTITVNGRRFNPPDQMIRPDVRVILEDVRTRGDRQHPFWVRLDGATGRVAPDRERSE